MRIRKRQVPLPLSSLLPVPLSDLYFNHSPTLFTDSYGASSSLHLPPPLPTTKTTSSDHLIRGAAKKKKKKKALYDDDDDDDDDDNYDDDDVDFDGKSIDASTSKNILPPRTSTQAVEIWNQKSVKIDHSIRKRRGASVSNFEEDEEEEEEEEGKKGIRKKGRRSSSSLLEEGSRCSRVNGRGWRCCQQTLVGYSLCQHHLGKGRLRSIKTTSLSVLKKKRVKLGMVKARSISSLLGQTTTSVAAPAAETEITAPADHFVEFDDK